MLINRHPKNRDNKHSYSFIGQLEVRKDAEGKTKKFIYFPSGDSSYIAETSKVLTIPYQNNAFRMFAEKYNGGMVRLKFQTKEPLDDDQGFMILPEKCQIISMEILNEVAF